MGQGGERGQLGSGAAVGQRVGQISWARGCCSQALVEAERDRLEGIRDVMRWCLQGAQGWLEGRLRLQVGVHQLLQMAGALLAGEAV